MKAEVHSLPDSNNITALAYSAESSLLAVGDSQGALHLYSTHSRLTELTAFISHTDAFEPESQHCETKVICSVRQVYALPRAVVQLATNERTVKLWKVEPRSPARYSCRRSFSQAYQCGIHSLSVCSSQQQFLC